MRVAQRAGEFFTSAFTKSYFLGMEEPQEGTVTPRWKSCGTRPMVNAFRKQDGYDEHIMVVVLARAGIASKALANHGLETWRATWTYPFTIARFLVTRKRAMENG